MCVRALSRATVPLTPAIVWVGYQVRDEERHGSRGGRSATRCRTDDAAATQSLGRELVTTKLTTQSCDTSREKR